MERNCISSLHSHEKVLEKECFSAVFCDSGDTPANLLCELDGHLMPCTSCLYGKWVEDVCAGQFGLSVYFVLCCLVGCCTWFGCCAEKCVTQHYYYYYYYYYYFDPSTQFPMLTDKSFNAAYRPSQILEIWSAQQLSSGRRETEAEMWDLL